MDTVTLYRAIGPGQMQAILDRDCARFPARLPQQKFFFPLLTEAFANYIAQEWNVPNSGVGYIVRFRVDAEYLQTKRIYRVGGPEHREYRIERDEFPRFNAAIRGPIEVVGVFGDDVLGVHEPLQAVVA